MLDLKISVGVSCATTYYPAKEYTWDGLKAQLKKCVRTEETVEEYHGVLKGQQLRIKDVGGYVGGTLKGNIRNKANMLWRYLITLDADYAPVNFKDLLKRLPYTCCAYTTHSHLPEDPRWRIVVPMSEPIEADKYEPLARVVASKLDIEWFDDTTYQPERLMFWSSAAQDGVFEFLEQDKVLLNPVELLPETWKDPTTWLTSSRTPRQRASLKVNAGDPLKKPGCIGAFNRAYTIQQAIAEFLPYIYTEVNPNRFTLATSRSIGGLVIYDENTFAYSHHAKDPCCGILCNAFDLVRIHLFGHFDPDEEYSDCTSESHKKMCEFAEGLKPVRAELYSSSFTSTEGTAKALFFSGGKYVPLQFVNWFLANYDCFMNHGRLHVYENGVYVLGDDIFKRVLTKMLGTLFSRNRVQETLSYLTNTLYELREDDIENASKWLNCRNGLVRLDSGKFIEHTPSVKSMIQIPINYNPDAKCPAIMQFLNEVAPLYVTTLLQTAAMCLLPTMKQERAIFLLGSGGNGKGTWLSVLISLLGGMNVSGVSLYSLTTNRFMPAELYNKLANINADIPANYIQDSSMFKTLTSGDYITAERKNQQPFCFRNSAKLLFSANALPPTSDHSDGFYRRLIIVPFSYKFDNSKLRAMLFEQSELEGLLNTLIPLANQLQYVSLHIPEGIMDICEEYREAGDSAYAFLKEFCSEKKGVRTSRQNLSSAYLLYCDETRQKPCGVQRFNSTLKNMFPGVGDFRGAKHREWSNLELRRTDDFDRENDRSIFREGA